MEAAATAVTRQRHAAVIAVAAAAACARLRVGHRARGSMQHGIIVYRASRLEALLPPLLSLMDAAPPAQALQPFDVIAAHPGIRQWLARAIARRRGSGGVAANLSIELPSAWLDRLAQRLLGESVVALRPYRREALRWRIHE